MRSSSHCLLGICCFVLFAGQPGLSQKSDPDQRSNWTDSFDINGCQFVTAGENTYWILKPSYQLVLQGVEGKDTTRLVITVLNETKKIGDVETRIVEEKESVNGSIVEISRNYFAVCTRTNTVFYFGEDVDMFKKGKLTGHGGSWSAGGEGAKAGVMMPGIVLLGSRYYQDIARTVAMDRAEVMSTTETIETPAGRFANCLKTEETTPLEPATKEFKLYAPGIGLVKDGELVLVRHGLKE